MSRHVDEQTLAAFREGLLPARKATRITAHLATCQRCAEVDAQLAAVTTILARTPAPPMPASLAARLDAALAAEIARSAAASPSEAASAAGAATTAGTAPPAGTATPAGAPVPASAASPAGAPPHAAAPAPGRGGRRDGSAAGRDTAGRPDGPGRAPWRLSLRLAAAAAAVVIVAGGGYAVAHVLSSASSGTSASSSGAASSHSGITAPSASGRPPEAAPAVPGAPGAPAGVLPVVASGTRYRPGHLPAQVGAVLKRHSAPARTTPAVGTARFPNLAACVDHLARGAQPQLVDLAYYDNHPAAVIVVPGSGAARLRVWVVGPGCEVITQVSMPVPG